MSSHFQNRKFKCYHKRSDGSLNINEGGICLFCGTDIFNVDFLEEKFKEEEKYSERYHHGGRKGKRFK